MPTDLPVPHHAYRKPFGFWRTVAICALWTLAHLACRFALACDQAADRLKP